MDDNSLTSVSDLTDDDSTVTKKKKEKLVYENDTSDTEIKYILNSSFSIIDRNKDNYNTLMKRSDETEYIYPSTKKRKYSTDSSSRNTDNSIKLEVNDFTDLSGFKPSVSHDLNTIIKGESPEIPKQKIIVDDIEIKNEILYSSPINSPSNNKQHELTKESNDIKDTSIISEKYDKCCSKTNSTIKHKKEKLNKHGISVELEDIWTELKIAEKNEQVSDSDKEKLKNLQVKLIHKVPPQHKIEIYPGSRTPTYHQQKVFKKYGPLRKGLFCPQEDEIIQKNWKMFCKLHNWDKKNVKPFLSFKYKGKFYIQSLEERQKFLQFLANGLPWRTLYSVYGRFKNLYRNHICKRYSAEENKKILAYVESESRNTNKYKKFSDLAKILKRTRHSLWLHYQHLKEQRDMKEYSMLSTQTRWTLPFITTYIKQFLKITRCQDVQELKNAIIPKAVWEKLQMKLNIDYKILRRFWRSQLHMQLFYPNAIYLNDIKVQLIEYMYEKGISNAREIIWPNIIKYFDGMTSTFLRKTFSSLMVESNVKKHGKKSFLDAIEYLYEKKIPEIKKQKTDNYLPRIQYTNGKIKIFSEEEMAKIEKHN